MVKRKKKWSRMKEQLIHTGKSLRDSKYSQLILFFLILFVCSGTLIFVFELNRNEEFSKLFDGLWWAIITFSTTGYGDKVPITAAGRITAVMSILFGVAAMSVLSGTLASLFVDRNTKARRGLMDFPKLQDHFIICGWKDHMADILLDILRVAKNMHADQLLIISNVETERVESLQERKELKGLRFVRGDYFSEEALGRANVTQANKVLILSDTYESSAPSEVDSKTVMTVLTIKAMARDVYTCAELMDRKYESYLKQAMCDEILFSRDFSRSILANTTVVNGISHIVQELLTNNMDNSHLLTEEINPAMVGKQYKELKADYASKSYVILLGLLENTGSPNKIKIEALREAQKTSDVSALVANLQTVKGLEVNRPRFIPPDDYIIQTHCRAIIIEKEEVLDVG